MTGIRLRWLAVLALCATAPSPRAAAAAAAQHLDSNRPEAWAMNYFTSLSLLGGLGPPLPRPLGAIEPGAELDWVPTLSAKERRVGFNGTKQEDLNQAPIFGRPRLTVGLPWNVGLMLSYLPPVRLFGVKPDLFAFGLERPLLVREPWTLGVRAYGQIGDIEGAFTCSRRDARFKPGSPENPAGCNGRSRDTAYQRYGGVEATLAYRIAEARGLTPYLAVAGNFLDNAFQVRAETFGFRDRTRLEADTWTFAASGGVVYPLGDRLRLSVGLFYSPLDVVRPPATTSRLDGVLNVRSLVTYRWR